ALPISTYTYACSDCEERVGAVEAGPLEGHADGRDDAPHTSPTRGARGEGVIVNRLDSIETLFAIGARIRVSGHGLEFYASMRCTPEGVTTIDTGMSWSSRGIGLVAASWNSSSKTSAMIGTPGRASLSARSYQPP